MIQLNDEDNNNYVHDSINSLLTFSFIENAYL